MTWPQLSSTIRQPALAVADVPSDVGKLPTITRPLRRATRAVVNPIPPGHDTLAASIRANWLNFPLAAICTIVVPVPCWLAPLLKLLMRKRPSTRSPLVRGTRAIPYGLTSPFAGTVVLMVLTVSRSLMKDPSLARAVEFATAVKKSAGPSTKTRKRSRLFSSMLVLLGLVHTVGMVRRMAGRTLGCSLGRVVRKLSVCCHFFRWLVAEAQREGAGLLPSATSEGVALTHLTGSKSAVEP